MNDHTQTPSQPIDWRETLPQRLPSLAYFANRPLHEQLAIITLATAGGAYVGGILLPTFEEVASGKLGGVPYSFWGVSLWLAAAGLWSRKKWLGFGWLVSVLFIISSWV